MSHSYDSPSIYQCADYSSSYKMTEFRPPATYYTSIPLVSERATNRQWDAAKLREFRKRIDSGTCYVEEIDQVAGSLMDGEIVELASDWLGNTVCFRNLFTAGVVR